MESVLEQIILYYKKRNVRNDIAHASTELLETEMQNRYFSRYLKSPEARAISELLASIAFRSKNLYLYIMTIEQKKISLINWITNLDDEVILDQIVGFQKSSLDELPDAIVQLLKKAEAEPEENLVKHTSTRDILKMR